MSDSQFTVRRLGWHQSPYGDNYTRRLPTAEPVAHHDTFDEAEYDRRSRENEARSGENPFRFGGETLYFQTSLDGPRLHDWLLDAGIDPPIYQLRHQDWREWWNAFAHTWTEGELAHAWHGLDKVRFFDLVEEGPTETFRVVVEVQFANGNRAFLDADREGGTPVGVYRNARTASAACERLNRARQAGDHRYRGYYYLRLGGRIGYGNRDRDEQLVREIVFFEVTAIPGTVPRHAGVAFLVQRRAFDTLGRGCHNREGQDTGSRVPVRLFADRTAANAFRDELTATTRAVMNPFQVFTPLMARRGEQEFIAAIEQLGTPLPWPVNFHPERWREWWDLCQDEISPNQRMAAWELFEDQPLFEVLRVDVHEE